MGGIVDGDSWDGSTQGILSTQAQTCLKAAWATCPGGAQSSAAPAARPAHPASPWPAAYLVHGRLSIHQGPGMELSDQLTSEEGGAGGRSPLRKL